MIRLWHDLIMASHGDLSPELKKIREKHRHFYLSVYTSTDALTNGYACGGGLDIGLNEAGIEDARKLSRRFKNNPIHVKKVVAGPELRTIQLADFLHDSVKGKIVIYREFADQYLGDWEGKTIVADVDVTNPPRGETHSDFSVRVLNGLVRMLQDDQLSLLATHPRVARMIFTWIGLGKEAIKPGVVYSVDLPEGMGIARFHEV
jgi:broad specificity phosphatase PhoE